MKISFWVVVALVLLAILFHTVWHPQAVELAKFLVSLFILIVNLFVGTSIPGGPA